LNWCGRVIRGGRTFTRNLINMLTKASASESFHYIRISAAAKSDVKWWLVALDKFNGTAPFNVDIPKPAYEFATDACLSGGAGYCNGDWFYVHWSTDFPGHADSHINTLELLTILCAARRWAHTWRGQHILVRSDNVAAVAAINNTSSRSPELLLLIKELYWLSVEFGFRLSSRHIAGKLNVLSDKLSRLCCFNDAVSARYMLTNSCSMYVCCAGHMSYYAFMSLQCVWRRI